MMDHMRQHDWCSIKPGPFVDEVDLDNCVTERILRNKFFDPLISSDDEQPVAPIDWEAVFKKRRNMEWNYKFIPGYHKPPLHPRLSSLTWQEHYQCIKVLSSQNPHIKTGDFMPRPVKADFRAFEKLSEKYAQEQKEYIEWAKTVWVTANCVRALRPKPLIENVYEAEFKMRMHVIDSFPKLYSMAAQIPVRTEKKDCEIVLPKKDLIEVNTSQLPEAEYPNVIDKKITVLQACPLPLPCTKHPCKFQLPTESTQSILPLTEVNRQLAQFALDNGCQLVASEGAVRSLLRLDSSWTLPVTVCRLLDADGSMKNVVVLSSEAPARKDFAATRTYKAYRHLLVHAFTSLESNKKAIFARGENHDNDTDKTPNDRDTPQSTNNHRKLKDRKSVESTSKNERESSTNGSRCSNRLRGDSVMSDADNDSVLQMSCDSINDSDSSDDDRLLIDIAGDLNPKSESKSKRGRPPSASSVTSHGSKRPNLRSTPEPDKDHDIGILACSCKGSEFETPRPRSYRKWKIKNKTSDNECDVIIHCSHKLRNGSTEVILEPIPEYQLEIGGSLPSGDQLTAQALALLLRRNANLINVRIDGPGGEVVTIQHQSYEDFCTANGDLAPNIADTLHTTADQLAGLLPGYYQLQHEECHGANAMLYAQRGDGAPLHADGAPPSREEARRAQAPPRLAPVLLPYHKARRQLPCAFTHNERQVARESPRPPAKTKHPPKALTWPKKKRGKKKK